MPSLGSSQAFKVGDTVRFTDTAVRRYSGSSRTVRDNHTMIIMEIILTGTYSMVRGSSGEEFPVSNYCIELLSGNMVCTCSKSYMISDDLEDSDKEIIEQYLIKAGIQ